MAAPTNAQLLSAIAALARGYTLPSPTGNQTGIFNGPGNQLQIPIDGSPQGLNNQQLGAKLVISADSQYVYVNLNTGDVSSGV